MWPDSTVGGTNGRRTPFCWREKNADCGEEKEREALRFQRLGEHEKGHPVLPFIGMEVDQMGEIREGMSFGGMAYSREIGA